MFSTLAITAALSAAAWAAPLAPLRVAALHEVGTSPPGTTACKPADAVCRLEGWVRVAADGGATLVVSPEYALDLDIPATIPPLGSVPPEDSVLRRFADLSDSLDLYLVMAIQTAGPTLPRNSQLAFGPDGTLLAIHHKIELFDAERGFMQAGTSVTTFPTPHGPVGMLICADLYGNPALHRELTEDLGAVLIAVSAQWTVTGALSWPAAWAHDWSTAIVFANGSGGSGRGSGVFDPTGAPRATTQSPQSGVVFADLQLGPVARPHKPPTPSGG